MGSGREPKSREAPAVSSQIGQRAQGRRMVCTGTAVMLARETPRSFRVALSGNPGREPLKTENVYCNHRGLMTEQ